VRDRRPSGSGKSTLLYIIGTLERASSGLVQSRNDVAGASEGCSQRCAHGRIGFVFQQFHLLEASSALDKRRRRLLYRASVRASVATRRQALDAVGLAHRVAHTSALLSGGERQRVAIAPRTRLRAPIISPTSHRQPRYGHRPRHPALLHALNAQGTTRRRDHPRSRSSPARWPRSWRCATVRLIADELLVVGHEHAALWLGVCRRSRHGARQRTQRSWPWHRAPARSRLLALDRRGAPPASVCGTRRLRARCRRSGHRHRRDGRRARISRIQQSGLEGSSTSWAPTC